MKKNTRIGLLVLVTLVLLLAMTIPGLAKKDEPYRCNIMAVVVNRQGHFGLSTYYGELEAFLDGDTLINNCTGNIPFGEQTLIGKGWWYATFDETCAYWGDRVVCDDFKMYSDQDIWDYDVVIFDPDTEDLLPADEYTLTIDSDGNFEFYKAYNP